MPRSALCLVLAFAAACTAHTKTPATIAVGQPMPSFSLPSLGTAAPLSLSDFHGRVVLLNLWASWCAPCKEELPLFDDLMQRVPGVTVVAVSLDEDRAAADGFLRTRPTWAIRFAHDAKSTLAERLQPANMPTSYVIDREGRIAQVVAGFHREDLPALEARLRTLAQ